MRSVKVCHKISKKKNGIFVPIFQRPNWFLIHASHTRIFIFADTPRGWFFVYRPQLALLLYTSQDKRTLISSFDIYTRIIMLHNNENVMLPPRRNAHTNFYIHLLFIFLRCAGKMPHATPPFHIHNPFSGACARRRRRTMRICFKKSIVSYIARKALVRRMQLVQALTYMYTYMIKLCAAHELDRQFGERCRRVWIVCAVHIRLFLSRKNYAIYAM